MSTIDQILGGPHANAVIDVSHENGVVDFAAAHAGGLRAVLLKASQGTGFVDPMIAGNVARARAAGLLVGAYHFGTGDDPGAQAQHFLSAVRGLNAAPMPLALDWEPDTAGSSMTAAGARTFVGAVRQATGRSPGLYSGETGKQLLGDSVDPVLGACWLWLAQYDDTPVVQRSWPRWTLWQYSDGTLGPMPHDIPGLRTLDRTVFNGDAAALTDFWAAESVRE